MRTVFSRNGAREGCCWRVPTWSCEDEGIPPLDPGTGWICLFLDNNKLSKLKNWRPRRVVICIFSFLYPHQCVLKLLKWRFRTKCLSSSWNSRWRTSGVLPVGAPAQPHLLQGQTRGPGWSLLLRHSRGEACGSSSSHPHPLGRNLEDETLSHKGNWAYG